MRLLNTYTGEFEDFFNSSSTPQYAILSHTWDPCGEQTHQDVRKIQEAYRRANATHLAPLPATNGYPDPSLEDASLPLVSSDTPPPAPRDMPALSGIWDPSWDLSEKIRKACEVARRDGYRYIWIDSCCIDKTSSSELSEAINSMFQWYGHAHICYAFLSDVPIDDDVKAEGSGFCKSRWFTRGWTLQELIAPRLLSFLSKEWIYIGSKRALADVVCDITGIDRHVLVHDDTLDDASVAQRMSWAATRQTTRVEDRAYCLLGIFGINMPTLYGEGAHAFRRLQEEILRKIPEQSLFAWGRILKLREVRTISNLTAKILSGHDESFFPLSPSQFKAGGSRNIICVHSRTVANFHLPPLEYTTTPHGLRTRFCLLPIQAAGLSLRTRGDRSREWYLAILGCSTDDGMLLGRVCYAVTSESRVELAPGEIFAWLGGGYFLETHLLAFSLDDIEPHWRFARPRVQTVHLSSPKQASLSGPGHGDGLGPGTFHLELPERNRAVLLMHGWTVSDGTRQHHGPAPHSITPFTCESFTLANDALTLTSDAMTIHIKYLHMQVHRSAQLMAVCVWVSSPNDDETLAISAAPYAAAGTWLIHESAPVVSTTITVLSPSGGEVPLQLDFQLMTRSLCNIHITTIPAPDPTRPWCGGEEAEGEVREEVSLRRVFGERQGDLHSGFKLILLASARMALEKEGYIVSFEWPAQYRRNAQTLTISKPGFAIVIKYFHELRLGDSDNTVWERYGAQDLTRLVLVALVSLESTSPSLHGEAPEAYQDGPYILQWEKWWACQAAGSGRRDQRQVALTSPSGDTLTVHLSFDLVWLLDFYVHVDLGPECPRPTHLLKYSSHNTGLKRPHSRITFTLPGHTKRTLQAGGYAVHFQNTHHSLTLSTPDFVIAIDYSHILDRDGSQLTLWADVKLESQTGSSNERRAPDSSSHTQRLRWDTKDTWDEKRFDRGWVWELRRRQVALVPSTGGEIILRLGFDLMWYTQYCLFVEVDPPVASLEMTHVAETRPRLSRKVTLSRAMRRLFGG